jgi:hypothetical protein
VLVDVLDLRQGAVGIVVLRRGDEGRQVLHKIPGRCVWPFCCNRVAWV